MLKYYLVAAALKAASLNQTTKKFYRAIGNTLGQKKRQDRPIQPYYFERVKRNVTLTRNFGMFQGGKMLEVGTGWMHWEAVTTRLFFDFEATLYDVWDNRQFAAMRRYLRGLRAALATGELQLEENPGQAIAMIDEICAFEDFQQVYARLGFEYVMDPMGELASLPDDTYDVVISAGVLEHVGRESAPRIIRAMSRVLKPGGYCIHSINITDHLYLYDRTASPKQYLSYSEAQWKRLFENEVQYINRIQRPEWFQIFSGFGFELVQESSDFRDIGAIPIAPQFAGLAEKDRNCLTLNAVFRLRP